MPRTAGPVYHPVEGGPAAVGVLVECIVPAAGRSERMGRWKPVLPFGSSTIVETVVEHALVSCARVLLVTGFRGAELAALFRGHPRVQIVPNPDWEQGMFSSVRRGVAATDAERFFVTPGDMPWITPQVYATLLDCAQAAVVFPAFGGRRGHPVLFSRPVREAVLAADPSTGRMRDIAERFPVTELAWDDDGILKDIDTEEDYR